MTRRFRLMLVDDNIADCLLAEEAINYPGMNCEFTFSESGLEVLKLLNSGAALPDLLLLDINMPMMNGFEVLEAIKTSPALQHLPVVMFSTSQNPEDILEAYDRQANSYVVKPVEFAVFQEHLGALLTFWRGVALVGWP